MFRNVAGRLAGSATSTVRWALVVPISVSKRLARRVMQLAPGSDEGPADAPAHPATAATRPAAATAPAAGTEAPAPAREDEGPNVVLSLDAPPEQVEPPEDVVGEALAAEHPVPPQPDHVEDETEIVYSSSSEND